MVRAVKLNPEYSTAEAHKSAKFSNDIVLFSACFAPWLILWERYGYT